MKGFPYLIFALQSWIRFPHVCFVAEYSLEDSDLEGLSDITVSSVHTSDLSSFEDDSEDEDPLSESTEEGEITSEGETQVLV